MNWLPDSIKLLGLDHPLTYLAIFLGASLLMIWRMEALMDHGLEGTALGTLVMPYCSGLGNLMFVYILLRDHGEPTEIMTNCLVNNTTNLTFLLGLPAVIWGLDVMPRPAGQAAGKNGKPKRAKKPGKADAEKQIRRQIGKLSLLLTMAAVVFFTGAVWVLGRDGKLDLNDGAMLAGLFLFWQCFQVFDVLKHNVRQKQSFGLMFYVDLLLLLVGAYLLYVSLDWLMHWLSSQKGGFVSAANLGWLSGWLMVLPNAILALYYGRQERADIVYSSQVGDGHICIPLCIGLFAIFKPVPMPAFFDTAVIIMLAATAVHFLLVWFAGRLPRWAGWGFLGAYGWFVYAGLVG